MSETPSLSLNLSDSELQDIGAAAVSASSPDKMSARQASYFSLAAETRNQIIDLVLVPVNVYIKTIHLTQPASHRQQLLPVVPPVKTHDEKNLLGTSLLAKPVKQLVQTARSEYPELFKEWRRHRLALTGRAKNKDGIVQAPGYQLISTCLQAYNEGHPIFYTINTFHLPLGPLANTLSWFNKLQPEHRMMIKTMASTFSLSDIPPKLVTNSNRRFSCSLNLARRSIWREDICDQLYNLWREKLDFLLNWGLSHELFMSPCSGPNCWPYPEDCFFFELGEEEDLKTLLHVAGYCVSRQIQEKIDLVGWQATKSFLANGALATCGHGIIARGSDMD